MASALGNGLERGSVGPLAPEENVGRYAAFLRGMNVGGRRVANERLRSEFEAIGFRAVAVFRASGNVVFAAARPDPGAPGEQALRRRIEDALASGLGYAVPTVLRSEEEVRAIAASRPFTKAQLARSGGKLQVSLLAEPPSPEAREEVLAMGSAEDVLAFGARELYWLPSGGLLESDLDLAALDTVLGMSTRRTKGTIEQLAAKHLGE